MTDSMLAMEASGWANYVVPAAGRAGSGKAGNGRAVNGTAY